MLKRALTFCLAVIVAAGYFYSHRTPTVSPPRAEAVQATAFPTSAGAADAFRNHRTGIMVTEDGVIDRVLSDDVEGDRHQRFTLRMASGQTILVAHNIDLASRAPVQAGSHATVHGEYEWNSKGGVIHWTHKDPRHKHEAGWIEFKGRRYD